MLNHTVIQGRLVDAPAFGDTNAGGRYANFRLAWSEKYKEKENKLFLDCKAFGGTAVFMEKFMKDKGQEILVEGKLNTEEWTNQDGQKRSKTALVVSAVHFCGSRKDGAAEQETTTQTGGFTAVEDDAMPF